MITKLITFHFILDHHPAGRTSLYRFLLIFFFKREKRLCRSALASNVVVAQILVVVILVHSRQTGFSNASIDFNEKPMVHTEPTGILLPSLTQTTFSPKTRRA